MFLRLPDLIEKIGVSKSTIYDWMDKGQFPRPRQLGPRCVGWWDEEVQKWIDEREPTHTESSQAKPDDDNDDDPDSSQ